MRDAESDRMRFGRTGSLLALALALASSSGCGTRTSTTQLWSADDYRAEPLRRVIVFGRNMAEPQRRAVEDRLATALAGHGVTATTSYRIYPALPAREITQAELAQQGFDGAFVTTLHAVRERQSYVPGHYHAGGMWGGYYGGGMGWGWSPGYVVTDELVDAETAVFDLRGGGRLVWSAMTRTMNPTSSEDLTKSMSREILPSVAKNGIIPRKE
jgi:hypothetical protein